MSRTKMKTGKWTVPDELRSAPKLGQDNRKILQDIGYSENEVSNFLNNGVIK